MDTHMTLVEAAAALGLSVSALRTRAEKGYIQAEKVGPRMWLIPRDEVEKWKGKGRLKAWEGRQLREKNTATDSSDAFEACRPVAPPNDAP